MKSKYCEIKRPNEYPILVRMPSPLLLYVFYKDHGYVYFGEPKDSIYGKEEQPRERINYQGPVDKEIRLTTENGGKVVRYNEKYYLIYNESLREALNMEKSPVRDKYPIALINDNGDIVLLWKRRSEHWMARGNCYKTSFADLEREYKEKRYTFQEEDMYTENGHWRLGTK